MKKNKSPENGLSFLYKNFISEVNKYNWADKSDFGLKKELRKCAEAELPVKLYSIVKEIIFREKGITLFESQIAAAYSMQCGNIAELPTGEGKTLAAVVTAACYALQGRKVHVLVFNDYLARRDYSSNLSIFEFCGLSCGFIDKNTKTCQRKKIYLNDIVYLSAKEACFDFLRDFLCMEEDKLVFPEFQVALIDEADSILIDEARIPIILAGNTDSVPHDAESVCRIVSKLDSSDVSVNKTGNQVWLTENGIAYVEKELKTGNLFNIENTDVLAMVNAALEARFLLEKDKDYIIKDNIVQIIDESTGRVTEGRRFPELLHRAVEAYEQQEPEKQSTVFNSISMQSFLLLYKTLCGMTGTAYSSADEIKAMYNLNVDVIEPHLPCIRNDHDDKIFINSDDKIKAVLNGVKSAHEKGQPVLLCTQSVYESEMYSSLLNNINIPHNVLNARNDEVEAEIIEQAGEPYRVTVSTNMAGRGVDIKLGGKNQNNADFIRQVGGLLVISTGINRSLRIDNQLRGRAGRQGDPGESQFFISLDESFLKEYFNAGIIKSKNLHKSVRRAQKMQESKDAGARYMLEKYSWILEQQRRLITSYRSAILKNTSKSRLFKEMDKLKYTQYLLSAGERGVALAEKQFTLYYINQHWSNYLSAMDDVRNGIHLMIIGGKNPIDEYHHFAISAFNEMLEDITADVACAMNKYKITENGIDLNEAGLTGVTTTWTYMVDESSSQFSRIPYLIQSVSNNINGTVFSLKNLFNKLRNKS